MMGRKTILFGLLALLPFVQAEAAVKIVSTRSEQWSPQQRSDVPGLKSFNIQVDRIQVSVPGSEQPSFLTRMFADYETDRVEDLTRYGLVQFIKGCQYTMLMRSDGSTEKRFNISREYYGGIVPYKHSEWMIDGVTRDPLDWGFEKTRSRHFYYKSSSAKGDFDSKSSKYYGQKAPSIPWLYVSDRPGTVFFEEQAQQARVQSLQFRICLYRSEEVPEDVPATKLDFAEPIKCFDWSSSWLFDPATKSYHESTEIDPFCLQ